MIKRLLTALFVAGSMLTASASSASVASAQVPVSCRGLVGVIERCPSVMQFRRGYYGSLVNGRFSQPGETRYYLLNARAGQRLTLMFTGVGAMRAGITFPNGGGDGPFSGKGNTVELPVSGDYIIYVSQNTMAGEPWAGNFTLAVLVK